MKFQAKENIVADKAPILAQRSGEILSGEPIKLTNKEAAPTLIAKPTRLTAMNWLNSFMLALFETPKVQCLFQK